MQRHGLFLWTKQFFLLELFFALACGISQGVAADASLTNNPVPGRQFESASQLTLKPSPPSIWAEEVGQGFRKGAQETGFAAGWGFGVRHGVVGASTVSHNLALLTLHYGLVLSDVVGRDHWFGGNWEFLAEGFGGAQVDPRTHYLAGGAAFVRYNFRTGTRWVPFFDLGGGCLLTDIKQPDLSSVFQFNEQAGPGVQYFWRDNAAITFQWRYMHISNAGIKQPNNGVNTSMLYAGMSWFF